MREECRAAAVLLTVNNASGEPSLGERKARKEGGNMQRAKLNLDQWRFDHFLKSIAVALLMTGIFVGPAMGQQKDQKTFSSPEEASEALYTAAQNNDEKAVLEILGQHGKEIISSGDQTEDAQDRANFVERYEEMHRLVKEPDNTVTVYIGAKNWPVPIPIVNNGDVWYFDTAAGKREILIRRIGRNEISTIRVCSALVEAQKEYYSQYNRYAQKIFSDAAKHDGLYWKAGENEPQSPIGPLVARAVAERFAPDRVDPAVPYHGYFFHVLTGQGKNAPGGAKNYIVDGKMTAGFAFVAYPAEYRSSGVKTFLVSTDGVVLEKDLGKSTEAIGNSMKRFNPDSTWQKTDDEQ
jgi:Protein of unknown function (DUF2950)